MGAFPCHFPLHTLSSLLTVALLLLVLVDELELPGCDRRLEAALGFEGLAECSRASPCCFPLRSFFPPWPDAFLLWAALQVVGPASSDLDASPRTSFDGESDSSLFLSLCLLARTLSRMRRNSAGLTLHWVKSKKHSVSSISSCEYPIPCPRLSMDAILSLIHI